MIFQYIHSQRHTEWHVRNYILGVIISHQSITKTRVKSHCILRSEHCNCKVCGDDSYVHRQSEWEALCWWLWLMRNWKFFAMSWLNDNVKVNILKTERGNRKILDLRWESLTVISISRRNSKPYRQGILRRIKHKTSYCQVFCPVGNLQWNCKNLKMSLLVAGGLEPDDL